MSCVQHSFSRPDVPEDDRLDAVAAGEEAVVLHDGGFVGADGVGDVRAFAAFEHDVFEGGVEGEVVVEGVAVLAGDGEEVCPDMECVCMAQMMSRKD